MSFSSEKPPVIQREDRGFAISIGYSYLCDIQ